MQPLDADEPRAIGPYRLLGRLGSGGMGRVYLGRSAGGRTVAVKIVHPHFALDAQFRARFRREVEAARQVGGDWTAPVLDADPEASVPWVATGYVAGPSLAEAVTPLSGAADAGQPGDGADPARSIVPVPPAPLPESSVRVLGASLAEALAHVHSLGLVHRDVKPSNVLLTMDGPRLIDFGIARATDGTASLTSTGASIGSPGYMAPEQIVGKGVTGAADIFSLGAVLAFAATGRPPFPGDSSAALLYKVVHEEPELDGLTGDLLDVVTRCLAKDPAVRPTPQQLAHRLAPQGAAGLVAAGWLPAPLVTEVGRSAVRLLDLEAAAPDTPPEGPPASSDTTMTLGLPAAARKRHEPPAPGSDGTPPPPAPGPSLGVFGPPDPSYGQQNPHDGQQTPHDGRQIPQDGKGPHDRNGPHDRKGPQGNEDGRSHPPGRLSLSLSATTGAASAAAGRGRRLSCTVALAVAGALAAVTVGSVFVFDLLPGGGGGATGNQPPSTGGAAGDTGEATPSGDGGSDGPTPQAGAVPKAYFGTWRGDATAAGIPDGTFELVVHKGKVGGRFATLTQTDLLGGVCKDDLILKKVADDRITATGKGDASNGSHCSQTAHTIYLKPVGDDLQYTSDDPAAGDPKARLSKTD
ncbi:serine/threonine-protein kinase [Streptomyces odontomachi]|uniref:serine/threonine-protein kinase n=1 Tax=Streptomyces odontomachi TaxID=2944940 RepID=UPI00210B0215|nr:serine/threonine-protein kinase [Streptomyces sp. ODS25]